MFTDIPFISKFFDSNIKKINFEDVQYAIKDPQRKFLIINTLPGNEQDCLIKGTLPFDQEELIINELLKEYNFNGKEFVIYGKNMNDSTVEKRIKQLQKLGFLYVYIYLGGMFEWLHLQDIYGFNEFPTTKKTLDILKYKPVGLFNQRYITNY
jgi:hypothetical protein